MDIYGSKVYTVDFNGVFALMFPESTGERHRKEAFDLRARLLKPPFFVVILWYNQGSM